MNGRPSPQKSDFVDTVPAELASVVKKGMTRPSFVDHPLLLAPSLPKFLAKLFWKRMERVLRVSRASPLRRLLLLQAHQLQRRRVMRPFRDPQYYFLYLSPFLPHSHLKSTFCLPRTYSPLEPHR